MRSFRDFTPYGDVRGTAPSSWVGQLGYLGVGTSDAATGLTNVGAREYDPSIGRFASVDPVFESGDARQMGGYAYAGDNPVTTSDPSGRMVEESNDGGDTSSCGNGVYASGCATGTANGYESSDDEAAADAAQDFSESTGTDYVYILGEVNKSGGNPKVKPSWREGPDKEYTRGDNADEPYVLPSEEGQGVSAFLTPEDALAASNSSTSASQIVAIKVPVAALQGKLVVTLTPDGGVGDTPQGHVTIGFPKGLTKDQADGMKSTLQGISEGPAQNKDGSLMTKANYAPASAEESSEAFDELAAEPRTAAGIEAKAAGAEAEAEALSVAEAEAEAEAAAVVRAQALAFAEAEAMALEGDE